MCEEKVNDLDAKISVMKTKEFITDIRIKQLTSSNDQMYKLNNSLTKKADRRKTFGIFTTGVSVILTGIILLK